MNDTPDHSSGSERNWRSAPFELRGAALKAAIDRMVADLECGEGQLLLRAGLRLERQALRCAGASSRRPAVELGNAPETRADKRQNDDATNPSND